jgi:hypothetical protein
VPYRLPGGVWESPVAVPRFLFWNLPLFGGFALRVLPPRFISRRLVAFNRTFGPAVLHLHPWEIDAHGPEVDTLSPVVRRLKRVGRSGLERKLQRLLAEHSFGSIAEAFPVVGELQRNPTA